MTDVRVRFRELMRIDLTVDLTVLMSMVLLKLNSNAHTYCNIVTRHRRKRDIIFSRTFESL